MNLSNMFIKYLCIYIIKIYFCPIIMCFYYILMCC